MKQERILDALNGVETAYILDADPAVTHTRRSPVAAVLSAAACLVLVFTGFALFGRRQAAPAEPSGATKDPISVAQSPSDRQGQADSPEGLDSPRKDSSPNVNAERQTLLDYRIGDLYLGMPQAELTALLGDPDDQNKSNSGPVTFEDGVTRICWFYNLSGDPAYRNDLSVELADDGSGWVVNRLDCWGDALSLPRGIALGMTEESLLSLWPELSTEFRVEEDEYEPGSRQRRSKIYTQDAGDDLQFVLYLEDGRLFSVTLGCFYPCPAYTVDASAPDPGYSFAGSEITVWRRDGGGWSAETVTDQAAKRMEIQFSIEELVPLEEVPEGAQFYVDFGNGTVALVCAADESGAVYGVEDHAAFVASLESGSADAPQGLTLLQACRFPAGVWSLLAG